MLVGCLGALIRCLLWRGVGAVAVACAIVIGASALIWLAHGGVRAALRGSHPAHAIGGDAFALLPALRSHLRRVVEWRGVGAVAPAPVWLLALVGGSAGVVGSRVRARRARDH